MNYLEISILFLFIGFLIVFYISNLIYNKCMSEKTRESFEDAQAKSVRLAQEAAATAASNARQAEAEQKRMEAQRTEYTRLKALRAGELAANKALAKKWSNTRDSQFGKFNSYTKLLNDGTVRLDQSLYAVQPIHAKNEATSGSFSNSTPVQINNLKSKLSDFYTLNKQRDASILAVSKRITSVNNILAGAGQ